MRRYWFVLVFLILVVAPAIGTLSLDRRYRVLPPHVAIPFSILEAGLMCAFVLSSLGAPRPFARWTALAFCASGIAVNISNLAYLIGLMMNPQGLDGRRLLISAVYVWTSNVIFFAITYWGIDGGGPRKREETDAGRDFIFPEMTLQRSGAASFKPTFGDYLYVAFSTSTAFSATDTQTASGRIRALLVIQATIALATVAIVAARAVNIFPE